MEVLKITVVEEYSLKIKKSVVIVIVLKREDTYICSVTFYRMRK